MLDRGLTEDGAAQALGGPKHRVTARVKFLELPERAQQLIGEGVIHSAAIDQLRAIGTVAPNLLDAVIAYPDDGNAWAAERLTREPGSVLDAALTHSGNGKVFAAYLSRTRGSRAEHLTKERKLRGAIWSQRNLYRDVIEPARESAGIDFTLYDARHTFRVDPHGGGRPLAEVAANSDHSVGELAAVAAGNPRFIAGDVGGLHPRVGTRAMIARCAAPLANTWSNCWPRRRGCAHRSPPEANA
jgi:hypothetical protein